MDREVEIQVTSRTSQSFTVSFDWRQRVRLLFGRSVTIKVQRITTLTEFQSYVAVSVGDQEICECIGKPVPLVPAEEKIAAPWCSIIKEEATKR